MRGQRNKFCKKIMKSRFSKNEIIEIGNKLANAGLIAKYPPRSHSHDAFSLIPQTPAQYDWLKRYCGTTYNVVIIHSVDKILSIAPELEGHVKKTKSGQFCRIDIELD